MRPRIAVIVLLAPYSTSLCGLSLRIASNSASCSAWYALFAPKGAQPVVLDALSNALDKALDDDKVRQRLSDLGCNIPAKSKRGQKELAALVKSEIARWAPIIKAANIKLE